MQIPVSRKECICDTRRKRWLHCDAEVCRRCRKAHNCACLRARHHITNAKWGWESPRRKRIQANSTRDGGDGMLPLSSSTRAKEAKQVSQCTIHAQRRTRLKHFFFSLKKGCISAPCSMRHLKLILQVLQLQPLATNRDVASGYRHEARGSSIPFSVSASPLIPYSCGKGNDNKMLGVLATLIRTL